MFNGKKNLATVAMGILMMFVSNAMSAEMNSVVAENIKADAERCATGTEDGTIGHSINQAMEIHTELASATPNVESLFDVSGNCFSGLSQLIDLSFAIPSLGSILSAAQDAVMRYAQKQICTAVNEVTGMVTSPINQAIGNVNSLSSFADLNGLTNGLMQQGMSQIDPGLGSEYNMAPSGGTYTVDTNPFGTAQTDFGGSTSTNNGTNNPSVQIGGAIGPNNSNVQIGGSIGSNNGGMSNVFAQINSLNQEIATTQARIGPAQHQVQLAQQELAQCELFEHNNCSTLEQNLLNAQNTLNSLTTQIASLQSQLMNVNTSSRSYNTRRRSNTTQPAADRNSILKSIGNLFDN